MNKERAVQLIDCVLSEIVKTTEMDRDTFVDWLHLEVGMTDEEMSETNIDSYIGLLPERECHEH